MAQEYRVRPEDRLPSDGLNGASLSDLFRRLANESGALVRNEARLARLELKEIASAVAQQSVKIALGLGLLVAGGLGLTACLIIVIGNALGGAYWASALIVGGFFTLLGAVLTWNGIKSMQRENFTPEETIESLEEDQRFLQREARDFRNELMS